MKKLKMAEIGDGRRALERDRQLSPEKTWRYRPHQGVREIELRKRQEAKRLAKAQASAS